MDNASQELSEHVADLQLQLADRSAALVRAASFSHQVAHDLKTPLRALRLLAARIEADLSPAESERMRQDLALLRHRASELSSMIDGIAEYCLATDPPSPSRVDTAACARRGWLLAAPHMRVKVDLLPPVFVHPTPLTQVFQNVLANAAQHGRATSARISSRRVANKVRIEIEDDGLGLATSPRLAANSMEQGGAYPRGRDLGLVRDHVAEWGGEMGINASRGRGATVWFTVPAAARPRRTAA